MRVLLMYLLVLLTACSPQIRTYSDYDHQYRIQDYQTYRWAFSQPKEDKKRSLYYNELNDKRIKGAVNDILKAKGYVLTENNAALIIDYHIIVEERSVLEPDPYGYYYGDTFNRPRNNIFYYREGTLILDLKRSETNDLIWRGWAVAAIEVIFYDTKNIESVIRSAVTKILLDFPESAPPTGSGLSFY